MLGNADAVRARRVDNEDAALAGRVEIDIVDACACPTYDSEVRRRLDELGRHLRGASDDEAVSIRHVTKKIVQRPAGTGVNCPSLCT